MTGGKLEAAEEGIKSFSFSAPSRIEPRSPEAVLWDDAFYQLDGKKMAAKLKSLVPSMS